MTELNNRIKEYKKKEKLKTTEWKMIVEGINEIKKTNPYYQQNSRINMRA